jgi:enoyl-CoA hydratase/carnithine racemase
MCIAAGLELALACDLIWAAASARFSQAGASIGTTTLLGGVQHLAERAGPARAREIIYSADQYDAATFERWNIVNWIVPDEVFEIAGEDVRGAACEVRQVRFPGRHKSAKHRNTRESSCNRSNQRKSTS